MMNEPVLCGHWPGFIDCGRILQDKKGHEMSYKETRPAAEPVEVGSDDLHEIIARRAQEIYERSGRIADRDVENWMQAEAEILSERKNGAGKSAVVVRVNGVQYVGEYGTASADGYTPGEFAKGDLVPVRFDGDHMFVKRANGKELATRIVRQVG
jgi:Protein of unknown function (DUF2934)